MSFLGLQDDFHWSSKPHCCASSPGIAVALQQAMTPEFKAYQQQVVANCKTLAAALMEMGYDIVTGKEQPQLPGLGPASCPRSEPTTGAIRARARWAGLCWNSSSELLKNCFLTAALSSLFFFFLLLKSQVFTSTLLSLQGALTTTSFSWTCATEALMVAGPSGCWNSAPSPATRTRALVGIPQAPSYPALCAWMSLMPCAPQGRAELLTELPANGGHAKSPCPAVLELGHTLLVLVQVMSVPFVPAVCASGHQLSPPVAFGRMISARWLGTSTKVRVPFPQAGGGGTGQQVPGSPAPPLPSVLGSNPNPASHGRAERAAGSGTCLLMGLSHTSPTLAGIELTLRVQKDMNPKATLKEFKEKLEEEKYQGELKALKEEVEAFAATFPLPGLPVL